MKKLITEPGNPNLIISAAEDSTGETCAAPTASQQGSPVCSNGSMAQPQSRSYGKRRCACRCTGPFAYGPKRSNRSCRVIVNPKGVCSEADRQAGSWETSSAGGRDEQAC